jgi:hypothetical protein
VDYFILKGELKMLKMFDLTENDIQMIRQIKTVTGAGSAREIVRRAIEEYHKKIFNEKNHTCKQYATR